MWHYLLLFSLTTRTLIKSFTAQLRHEVRYNEKHNNNVHAKQAISKLIYEHLSSTVQKSWV